MAGRSRDLVVVLPGILGSTLARGGRLIWAPSAGAVVDVIRTLGRTIRQLRLPDGIGDDHPGDGVEPVALMPDLHVLPGLWTANIGYDVLLAWLRGRCLPGQVLPVAYDWRVSNRYNGRRLKTVVEPALERWRAQGGEYADAQLVFVCHSMGGLVAQWYLDREGGAEVTRKLVTIGTPYRGAVRALDQLVNGVGAGFGRFRVDLSELAATFPSAYQLLPEYACLETPSGLVKTTETDVPGLSTELVRDGMAFHEELDSAGGSRSYDVHAIVGTRQPTVTTARLVGGAVEVSELIDGDDVAGDSTVPRLAASAKGVPLDGPGIHWVADKHGALQSNQAVLDQLDGVLTGQHVYRAIGGLELSVRVEELLLPTEPLVVSAVPSPLERLALTATVADERENVVGSVPLRRFAGGYRCEIDPLPPGCYTVVMGAVGSMASRVAPVTSLVLVWDPAVH
jgi:pimeloyl-ACP methyl ester carboxylesterase